MNHVSTQLPYAVSVAMISFITYIVAGFTQSAVISLPVESYCCSLICYL